MARYGLTHSTVILDSSSANSSTRTSNPVLVADASTIAASWTTAVAVASNLTIQGSNEEGQQAAIGLWSTVSVVAGAGIFTITPGARWLRFIRPAVDSQGSVVVETRSSQPMAGGLGAASFVVAPASTTSLSALAPSVTTFAAFVTGRPLWPSDVTGLVLWLPADQIQGIASGASLSAWTDSSTSAAHGLQASAASQPIFVGNVQNALSAVSFGAAISQFLISQTSLADTATVALAFRQSAATSATQLLLGSNTTLLRLQSSLSLTYASGSTLSVAGAVPTTWQTLVAFGSGSTTTVSLTGSVTTGTGPGVAGTSSTSAAIGAATASSKTWSGFLGEVLVWNRNLVEIERSSVESYLRTKWAI